MHRILHRTGGGVDILPFSDAIAPGGRLELQGERPLNMAGFEHVVRSAIATTIDDGLTLPLIPLPLYGLLKLVAFSDRAEPKDLAGVFHCLQHYLEDDERRYGAEHNGAGVPFEYTGAYLLGVDGRAFLGPIPRPSQESSTVSTTQTPMLSASFCASGDGFWSRTRTDSMCSNTSSGTGEELACDNYFLLQALTPWRYALEPHDVVAENMSPPGLLGARWD
jgi:hypothetical protein